MSIHFVFTITDGNGIESLDSFEFALLSRDQTEQCAIEYEPRFAIVNSDVDCFYSTPTVQVVKTPLQFEWQVEVKFRIAWNVTNASNLSGTPSLKVFDEGQNLGLGLSRLTVFDWTLSTDLTLGSIEISDQTLPIGTITANDVWVHSNDYLHIQTQLYYSNSTIPAQNLPPSVYLQATLADGERTFQQNMSFVINRKYIHARSS